MNGEIRQASAAKLVCVACEMSVHFFEGLYPGHGANSRQQAVAALPHLCTGVPTGVQYFTFYRAVEFFSFPSLKGGKYISEEVSALAFACGTHAPVTSRRSNEQNINEQMSEEKDPNQAGAEAKPEETAWRSVSTGIALLGTS